MSKVDFYEMHRVIHRAEVQELRNAVKDFGHHIDGHHVVTFCEVDEEPTDTERPCVAVNVAKWATGPQDVYINSIDLTPDDRLVIYAETKEDGMLFTLDTDDIEFGHVSFITDAIPDKSDRGEPSLVKTAEITTISGQYIVIETDSQHWYYRSSDESIRLSGTYTTDDDRPCTIIGFGGCNDLPYVVRDALKRLGYALEL